MNFQIPLQSGTDRLENLDLALEPGVPAFIVGPNGCGKSTLMSYIFRDKSKQSHIIPAYRLNYFSQDEVTINLGEDKNYTQNVAVSSTQEHARYRDNFADLRIRYPIANLARTEAARNAKIVLETKTEGGTHFERILHENPSNIDIFNRISDDAGLNFHIKLGERGILNAVSKRTGDSYSIPQLSDGERSALIMCADVLTQPVGRLILVDEPERHLHRSISARLINALTAARADCFFVISTHDIDLVRHSSNSPVVVLRSFDPTSQRWEAVPLPDIGKVGQDVIEALVGARTALLLIEGDANSLDRRIYEVLFPDYSVLPAGSCVEVERICRGLSETTEHHWLAASGIVDGDNSSEERVAQNTKIGVTTLPFASVEALYCLPQVLTAAIRQATRLGLVAEGSVDIDLIKSRIVETASEHALQIAARIAERRIRQAIFPTLPTRRDILKNTVAADLTVNLNEIIASAREEVHVAIEGGYDRVLMTCPLKQTPAIGVLASLLGYGDTAQLVRGISNLIGEDPELRNELRSLFPDPLPTPAQR